MMKLTRFVLASALLAVSSLAAWPAHAQATDSGAQDSEPHFSQAQLRDYYRVYRNGDVRYLRATFNAYLAGKSLDPGIARILRPWDKAYLRSRFTVGSREETPFGLTIILLVAQDRPDRVIRAIVYRRSASEYILRGLEDTAMPAKQIRAMQVRYRQFLSDTVHAL
jgi:hypothetical protein